MNMSKTRAVGIIRLSKTADPASMSIPVQREIIEHYAEQQGIEIVGWAEDKATSAFSIPPEKRKQVKEWLDQPDEYDCLIYFRQDRLVRRARDFMGIVFWCQQHDKKLYSATEGLGDVTQHAGLLMGFITAWQSEGESLSTSARVKNSQARLAREGRWRGGRMLYGFRAICICHQLSKCPDGKECQGWKLEPDENGTARVLREAARRVIVGESANAVTADFNRRGVLSADGLLWKALSLRRMLRHPALMDGIISVAEWNQLQDALNARRRNQYVRTLGRDAITLDLIFCERCGSKVYRWHDKKYNRTYGRCRNELKRAEAAHPCHLPHVPYEILEEGVSKDIEAHRDDFIETRITDATRRLRAEEIERELIELAAELAARRLDRAEFTARQTALLDERDALETADSTPQWKMTGETVGQQWDRLSNAERRLWLLRIGTTYTVDREDSEDGTEHRWLVKSSWRSLDESDQGNFRDRVVRADAALGGKIVRTA
jgi:site-specific DNA recombinase